MNDEPWKGWIPGVLSKEQVQELCSIDCLKGVDNWKSKGKKNPIGHSAIDLTLTNEGYEMTSGSVKPFGPHYMHRICKSGLVTKIPKPRNGIYTLEHRKTYLFKLKEKIEFCGHASNAQIYGQATAKSTIGRVDVLARLIVDGMDVYESFDPDGLEKSSGEMYLEITPMTFDVRVKAGISLSQLRLFRGHPEDSQIRGKEVYEPLLHSNGSEIDGSLSVELKPVKISGHEVSAFFAESEDKNQKPIDLWKEKKYDPCKYWKFLKSDKNDRITIDTKNFYLLRSKEMISLPDNVAVYCRAIDEAIGEMRIHYAGFVHPFFGTGRDTDDSPGTCLIFEVRGHDVDVSLKDGEKMAKLIFYRLSRPCKKGKSSYNEQTLKLSKIFANWPEKIKVEDDGSVKKVE
ncbi:MAG: 2'-deoxycytidine 5'-triphosphate deaminase [Sedimentisphaerales bacterium]|nr:2'-deoxycytidine 5'-triphosphate deaminase [Sedimentisphaerales bacterium]